MFNPTCSTEILYHSVTCPTPWPPWPDRHINIHQPWTTEFVANQVPLWLARCRRTTVPRAVMINRVLGGTGAAMEMFAWEAGDLRCGGGIPIRR